MKTLNFNFELKDLNGIKKRKELNKIILKYFKKSKKLNLFQKYLILINK